MCQFGWKLCQNHSKWVREVAKIAESLEIFVKKMLRNEVCGN